MPFLGRQGNILPVNKQTYSDHVNTAPSAKVLAMAKACPSRYVSQLLLLTFYTT